MINTKQNVSDFHQSEREQVKKLRHKNASRQPDYLWAVGH